MGASNESQIRVQAITLLEEKYSYSVIGKELGRSKSWISMWAKRYKQSPNKTRGVQYMYVHWVMHKCIMVKVGGKNTRKVCKKQVNLPKTGGKICKSRGERIIFVKQGGNVLKQRK